MLEIVISAIKLLGGLAMFLYGMEVMGDGLKQGSGSTLKRVLGTLTNNPLMGVITGALVTAVIQSSTATVVLTVGLIGAGILSLRQAVSIVLGANIGTTVTAQIIRLMDIESDGTSFLTFLEPKTLAPIALIIGIILIMFIKKESLKSGGMIAVGFGILFYGLMSMTEVTKPLSQTPEFEKILSSLTDMPIVGILVGLITTVIVQSSSAMVGIIQSLSSGGTMTFEVVYPIIMGINIGTCVTTAMVCSIDSSNDAKRTGVVHIVFNCLGTFLFMIALTILRNVGVWPNLWESVVDSGSIANFQTIFNLVTAVVLLPFTNQLVNIACAIVKDKKEDKLYPELAALDDKLMVSTTVALGEVAKASAYMAEIAKKNIEASFIQFDMYDDNRSESINETELRIDQFTDRADNYMIKLSKNIESESDNIQLNMLMQTIRDIERIGDYATNFNEIAMEMKKGELQFSSTAKEELKILNEAVIEILRLTVEALENDSNTIARRIEPLEEVIDDMVLLLKNRHTSRLCQGICSIESGLQFMDALTYYERTADQCSSIAMLILGKSDVNIMRNHHSYLAQLHSSGDKSYVAEETNRRQQYLIPLENIKF